MIHARPNHPLTFRALERPDSPTTPTPPSPGFSLQELVLLLVDTPEEKREAFQQAFLLLHPLFVTSASLLDLLANLYRQQSNVLCKTKVVQLLQKWLTLYPEDFINMKMRFRLRAKILEHIQALGEEASPLKEELRATLRLSEQAHVTIRPPSYYVEQSVKQIEATHPKDPLLLIRTKSVKDFPPPPDSSSSSSSHSPEQRPSPTSPLARFRSYARRDTEAKLRSELEPTSPRIVERPMGSIHETLKAQHYDPFSDVHRRDDDDSGEEPDPSKLSSPFSPHPSTTDPSKLSSPFSPHTSTTDLSKLSSPFSPHSSSSDLSPFSPRPLSISEPKTNGTRHWKGSEFLFELSAVKVCAAFTVMDHINLRAIKLRELSNKQWTRPDALTRAPNVVAMVEQYNARSYWVAAEVLLLRDQAQRVKALRFFIELAQECANVRNYFSVFSIIHGLNQSPLFRLQADWEKLPKSSKACLSNLKATITEPSNNFKVYKAIKHLALIPHLAYYTKLCFAFDELSLYVGAEQKINWEKKIMAIYHVLEEFQSCQKQALTIHQDPSLLELLGRLTHSVHSAATSIKVDSMWTLSYLYLPKPGRDANVIPLEAKAL